MLTNKWNATNPRQRDHHILDTWPAIMKVCFLMEEAIWKAASLRNLIARVSENRQDRVSNPRPEGDQTSGKRGRPALQVDPPLKIIRQDKWTHLWTILPLNSGQDNWNHLGTLVLVEFCSPSSEQSLNNGLGRWVEHHFFFFCFTDQMSQPLHCLLSAKQIRSS